MLGDGGGRRFTDRLRTWGGFSVLNSEDVCLIFATSCFFVIMQMTFWNLFGSKQLETVVEDKASLLEYFIRMSDPEVKNYVCHTLEGAKEGALESSEKREDRDAKNAALMSELYVWIYLFGFAAAVSGGAAISSIRAEDARIATERRSAFLFGLGLVLLSSVTEIYVFFGVITPHELVGDVELINLMREAQSEAYSARVDGTLRSQ